LKPALKLINQFRCFLVVAISFGALTIPQVTLSNETNHPQSQVNEFSIKYIWSKNISRGRSNRYWARDITISNDLAYILSSDTSSFSVDAIDLTTGQEVQLNRNELQDSDGRGVRRILSTKDQRIFIGGGTNRNYLSENLSIKRTIRDDHYIAKLDANGTVEWESTFGQAGWDRLVKLRALGINSIVAAGIERPVSGDDASIVTNVPASGPRLFRAFENWRTKVGNGKRIDIHVTEDDQIQVAAIDTDNSKSRQNGYSENIYLWNLSGDGSVVSKILVRKDMNQAKGENLADLAVTGDTRSTYVASSKMDWANPVPIQIVKVQAGKIVWKSKVQHSVRIEEGRSPSVCDPAMLLLNNGDLIFACSLGRELEVHSFDKIDGGIQSVTLQMPPCHRVGFSARLLLRRWDKNTIVVLGTRGESNFADGCAWIGLINDPT